MAEGDPEYTSTARQDLTALGRLTAIPVVVFLRQWSRGEIGAHQVPLHHADPDPRYVRLPGGLAAAFRMMRTEELARRRRALPAPLIVRVVPEQVLIGRRAEILEAIMKADNAG